MAEELIRMGDELNEKYGKKIKEFVMSLCVTAKNAFQKFRDVAER